MLQHDEAVNVIITCVICLLVHRHYHCDQRPPHIVKFTTRKEQTILRQTRIHCCHPNHTYSYIRKCFKQYSTVRYKLCTFTPYRTVVVGEEEECREEMEVRCRNCDVTLVCRSGNIPLSRTVVVVEVEENCCEEIKMRPRCRNCDRMLVCRSGNMKNRIYRSYIP